LDLSPTPVLALWTSDTVGSLEVGRMGVYKKCVHVCARTESMIGGEVVLDTQDSLTFMPGAIRRLVSAALSMLLICCVTIAVPGCGGKQPTRKQSVERYSQELREAVSTHVLDVQRRDQMLVIVDQVETLNLRFSHETADFIDSYRTLNADYNAARPAFDQLFSDYGAKRAKARSEALDLHFRLASLAAAAEWDSIGKAETELYEEVDEASPAKDGHQ
jgi:hypothetical protein